jgi:hypothetical protein
MRRVSRVGQGGQPYELGSVATQGGFTEDALQAALQAGGGKRHDGAPGGAGGEHDAGRVEQAGADVELLNRLGQSPPLHELSHLAFRSRAMTAPTSPDFLNLSSC